MTYSLDDDEYGDHTEKDMNMADETDGRTRNAVPI